MLAAALLLGLLSQEAPIEVTYLGSTEPHRLVRNGDGKEIPCQRAGDRFVLLAKNENAVYTVHPGAPAAFPKVECVDDGKSLTVSVAGKKVLRYNHAVVEQPDPVFSRSGYLHPIWTPSGKVITNDSPRNHLHHHGIWSAWTSSEFEGRKSNFWESKERQGRIECVKVEETTSGPVFGGFKARHRFINLNNGVEKVVLEEVWEVRVYALSDRFVFDLVSTQTCATDQPLVIREYRYGGIGFRGSSDWEGKTGVDFLTSEGKGRVDGHATKAKWVEAFGKVGGEESSIAFLCHTANFRFPQPLRIHPDEPFFNWAVPQGGPFSIEPGKPYVARYRFVVADGRMNREELDTAWSAYGEPTKLNIQFANVDK